MERASTSELRRFGVTVGGVFLALGAVSRWRGHTTAPVVLWTVGGLLLVPGLLAPAVLGPVRHVWMRAAVVLGEVNARIILTVLFYGVLTPIGFVLRRVRDPLDRSLADARASSWIRRPRQPVDPAHYQRQF